MGKQETKKPLDLTTALDNFSRGIMKMEYLSKRQRGIIINQWEARRASKFLYFYLRTSTTTRIEKYYAFKEKMIKTKAMDALALNSLGALLKEVEKEMKWRAMYPRTIGSIFLFKYIRL